MNKASTWLRNVLAWLQEPHLAWLMLLVIAMAVFVVTRSEATEPQIRLTGLVLQLLGIGTVAWGIRQTRRLFGRPSVVDLGRAWFARFPVYGGRVSSMSGGASLGKFTASGRGHVSANAGHDASVEARVEALEKNVGFLSERIAQTQNEMDQKFREHTEHLKQERLARSKGHEELSAKLEASETGGLHVSAAGVILLFLGVALTSASPEIQRWMN